MARPKARWRLSGSGIGSGCAFAAGLNGRARGRGRITSSLSHQQTQLARRGGGSTRERGTHEMDHDAAVAAARGARCSRPGGHGDVIGSGRSYCAGSVYREHAVLRERVPGESVRARGRVPKRARRMRCHCVRESRRVCCGARAAIGAPCPSGSPLMAMAAILFLATLRAPSGLARRAGFRRRVTKCRCPPLFINFRARPPTLELENGPACSNTAHESPNTML